MSSLIDLNDSNKYDVFCQFKVNKNNILVGMPLILNYSDSILSSPIQINTFYGLNIKENFDTSGMVLYIIDEKAFTQDEKSSIQDGFKIIKDNLNEIIKKSQPDFFEKLNKMCYDLHNNNTKDINSIIIKSLTNKNEQPLLLAGLSGYGKTASFEFLINNIRTKTIQQLQQIYNISEDKAKKIKNFTSTGFVSIDEESKKNKLMGNYSLEETDKGIVTILENGALGSLIKDCYYAHRQTLVVFDEILDSPEIMTAMKSALMPKDGKYCFTPVNSREFLLVEGDINFDSTKTKLAFFEVAQKSDNLYSCDDEALEIKTNNITIHTNKLTIIEKAMLNNSVLTQNYNENDAATIKRNFLTNEMSSLDVGAKILLISKEKSNEIKEYLKVKEIKKNKDFVLSQDKFKVCATGNVMHNIDVPTIERFKVINIGGINYSQLKNNLVQKKWGIDSQFINSLKPQAYEKIIDAIIEFAKNISSLQNQDVLMKPDFGMKQVPYSPNELTSPSLNPRLITNILNQSENLNDIVIKFNESAERILGIFGLPDEMELSHIAKYKDTVSVVLEKEFNLISKEYKIDYKRNIEVETIFKEIINKLDEYKIDDTNNPTIVSKNIRKL